MHIAILGNGITGVTAALHVRRRRPDWRVSLVSGESTHHYSRPALMYVFMGHMRYEDTKPYEDGFWEEQGIDLVRDWVTGIDVAGKSLALHRGGSLPYDKLLLATGSKPNRFGWPGQDLAGVQGLYGLMDLRRLYENVRRTRRAVIVGGGLIGIELAEMLHSVHVPVTLLVREPSYWSNVLPPEESRMVSDLIEHHGFDLRLSTELERIEDDGSGRVGAVVTKDGERIDCELVGLTAGVSPNLDVVADTGIETGRGILVDSSLRTSAPDVLAAGDCAEIRTEGEGRNLLQQVWYTGKMQGRVAADVLCGEERSYDPGIWYNSAKFLELEYQVYGEVNRGIPGERSLYWEDPDRRRAARIVHVDGRVIGFNFMGVRARHRVCERWIAEHRDVEHVLDHLEDAGFDPEFTRRYEGEARAAFRRELQEVRT